MELNNFIKVLINSLADFRIIGDIELELCIDDAGKVVNHSENIVKFSLSK